MSHHTLRILPIVNSLSLVGVPALTKEKLEDAMSELRIFLDQCTANTGYNPDKANALGDHEIRPSEGAYASCAYDGINRHLKSRSRIPEIYDRFIVRHKEMTAKVKSGSMTRDQRKAAIKSMVVSMRNQEEALEMGGTEKAASSAGDDKAQGSANTVKRMKNMKRIQDMQRQVNRSIRSLGRF